MQICRTQINTQNKVSPRALCYKYLVLYNFMLRNQFNFCFLFALARPIMKLIWVELPLLGRFVFFFFFYPFDAYAFMHSLLSNQHANQPKSFSRSLDKNAFKEYTGLYILLILGRALQLVDSPFHIFMLISECNTRQSSLKRNCKIILCRNFQFLYYLFTFSFG